MIKVAIIEDDRGTRESLELLISEADGLRCAGTYATAEEAIRKVAAVEADVALVDINLPRMNGIECVQVLKAKHPGMQLLMLTTYDDGDQIFNSLKAGASGYLLKRSLPSEIVAAVKDVAAGGSPMSQQIARKLVGYFHGLKRSENVESPLTNRETEILQYLSKGLLYKEIADTLGVSLGTVKNHLHKIYGKLHVQSRTEAVVKFLNR